MKHLHKRVISMMLVVVTLFSYVGSMTVAASWTEYSSWSGWSAWQDAAVSETDLCDVETRQVEASYNYKTIYHYYRYANASGTAGNYEYSSTYPYFEEYYLDAPLTESSFSGGYKYWYNGVNYRTVWACADNGSQIVESINYKTQYRYRTRSLIYYYTVSYNANGGTGAPSSQTKTGGTTLTLSGTVPTKSYTLTYNANGGNVSSSTKKLSCTFNHWKASNGSTYAKGGSYTNNADTTMTAQWTNPTAGTLQTPTRTGYTFTGWFTAASGGTQITSSSPISSNTTIYAHWQANTYKVKYNGNGNDSGIMSDSSHTYNASSTLTNNTFTKKGHTFNSWNTKSDGSGTKYANNATINNLSSSNGAIVNLYAQWVPNTYTVKYNGNGSTGGTMSDTTHTYGVSTNLPTNQFTKTHYVFNGWNTKSDGTGMKFSDATVVCNLTESNGETVTLYAQWTINDYTVSFNANGGTNPPGEQLKIHGIDLEITKDEPETAKKYTITYDTNGGNVISAEEVECAFAGWNTSKDGTGEQYTGGDIYSDNAQLTLYAQWNNPKVGTLPIPTREGYSFVGWTGRYQTASGWTDWVDFSASSVFSGNATLRATWKANTYIITFNANGGVCETISKDVEYGGAYGTMPVPTRLGYTFAGWYTSKTDGDQITSNTVVSMPYSISLYAHWTAKTVTQISVNFEKTKTTYYVGDIFDPGSVTLSVTYEDGEVQDITEGFACSTPTLNKISKKRTSVTYAGLTVYFIIDIINAPLSHITIKANPTNTEYSVGDVFSDEGIIIEANYSNGYVQEITQGLTYSYDFKTSGEKEVEISYTESGITATVKLNVKVNPIPKIYSNATNGECGKTISVPVYISGNTGIMGFGIEIEYDKSVLTPLSVDRGDFLAGNFDNSIETSANNTFRIYWTGSENVTENGLLFTIQFAVASNAYGEYSVKTEYISDDTFNENWDPVKLDCSEFILKITDPSGEVTKILANNQTAETGNRFEVPLRIVNNMGYSDAELTLTYDNTIFKPVAINNGQCVVSNNNLSIANGSLVLNFDSIDAAVRDGILCTVVFEMTYCDAGEYTIGLNCTKNIKTSNFVVTAIDGPAKIYVNNVEVANNIVQVPVFIQGNTGIMGIKLNFTYDSKVLTPMSVLAGNILNTGMIENNIDSNIDGAFSVIWVGNDDIRMDGELFVLNFELVDNQVQDTQISISYTQEDTYNSSWNDVRLTCEDINIGKTIIKEYQFIGGEVIIEAPSNLIRDGWYFDVQKIVPPPAEIVKKVKEQRGESSEVLAYYEIRLISGDGNCIIYLDADITIKTKMSENYIGSNCVHILQEDQNGELIEMDTWWEGEYLCYNTDWLEIYQ